MPVGDTYTSQFGLTPVGSQTQGLQDLLKTIQGTIPQPAAVQQDMQDTKSAYNIQGDKDYYNKLLALAQAHVQASNPGANFQQTQQTPSDAPQFGGIRSDYGVPILTQESNAAPQTGFTDPLLAAKAAGAEFGGVQSTLNLINDLIGKNYDNLQSNLKDKASMYSSKMQAAQGMSGQVLDAMKSLGLTPEQAADIALKTRAQNLAEFQAGFGPGGQGISDIYKYVDGLQSGQYSPDDIPANLRPAVDKKMREMGTDTEKIRQARVAVDAIKTRLEEMYARFNRMKHEDFLSSADKAYLDSSAQFLSEKIQRANIGGRITQPEIANALKQLPNLGDKLKNEVFGQNTAQAKLQSLFDLTLSASGMSPDYFPTTWGSGSSATTNSSDIDSKLSAAGFSPSDIAEYKKVRGIQ